MRSRAVVMTGARSMEVRELSVPDEPPVGGAIVQILTNGICGSDWDVYSGEYSIGANGKPLPFPMVLGHEPVGRIVAIDPVAEADWGVKEGDRVVVESRVRCGECRPCLAGQVAQCQRSVTYSFLPIDQGSGLWGGMAEYMVLRPHSSVFKVPEGLSDLDAALFNPWGNAFHWAIGTGGITVGDRVLVLGSGQRGLACAVAAHEAGAAQVISTGLRRDAHKLKLAKEFGATDTINVEDQDTVATVKELTEGHGIDVVIDTVPGPGAPILHGLEVMRRGATMVLAGTHGTPLGIPLDLFRNRDLRMLGATATTAWSVTNALRVLASGRYPLSKLHSHNVPFDEAEWAIRMLGGEIEGEEPIHVSVTP